MRGTHHPGDSGQTTLTDGTHTPKDAALVAAQGDLEEASTAIGAAITIGYVPDEFDLLLRNSQQTLVDSGQRLATASQPPGPTTLANLDAVCERHAADVDSVPAEFLSASVRSDTVALLKFARTVTRRAERALWALHTRDEADSPQQLAVFVDRLADVLLLVAFRIHRGAEQEWPVGWCGIRTDDVVRPTSETS